MVMYSDGNSISSCHCNSANFWPGLPRYTLIQPVHPLVRVNLMINVVPFNFWVLNEEV